MDKLERISFKDQKAIFGRLEQMVSQANLARRSASNMKPNGKSTMIISIRLNRQRKKLQQKLVQKDLKKDVQKDVLKKSVR